MQAAPEYIHELDRIASLRALGLLDSEAEERFDRYTRLAQRVFNVPIALISLVDEDRVWFKSKTGFAKTELPRDTTICSYAVTSDELLIVEDASKDVRFESLPGVQTEQGIRFYAGCPIHTTKGARIGTLCIMDSKPGKLNPADKQLLKDLAAMVESELSVQSIATIDELTGLSNRRGFKAIAHHALAMCERLKKPATLMFFDLDGFKHVNDTFGHAEGDKVLSEIGDILLKEFRNSDVISRLGGDEFCVLLTGTDAENVGKPLGNLNEALKSRNANHDYIVDYSVGTVSYDALLYSSIDDMLSEADQLMYDNKRDKKQPV